MCNYESNTGELLDHHFDNEHFKPQFKCTVCDVSLHTERMLKEHSKKHKVKQIACDYCGHKTDTISTLDDHIEIYHRISKGVSGNEHSNKSRNLTSMRRHLGSFREYTLQEKLSNGPCRFWLKGSCKYNENCKFAHVKVCHYQDKCKSSNRCQYYHHDRNNMPFLLSNSRPQPFQLNQNEFPPMSRQHPYSR